MKFFLLLMTLYSSCLYAQEEVRVIASDSIPPYVMANEKHSSESPGLQVEIINEAFKRLNKKPLWKMMPNHRLAAEFKRGNAEAAVNLPDVMDGLSHSSTPIVAYKNCIIGAKSLKPSWRDQIANLRVVGFQRASYVFKDLITFSTLKNYNEVTSQKTIAYHLLTNKTDLILSDALVFSYYAYTYFRPQFDKSDLVCLEVLKINRHLGFKDQKLRDDFNRALEMIKEDGTYDRIIKKYREMFSLIALLNSSTLRTNPSIASH